MHLLFLSQIDCLQVISFLLQELIPSSLEDFIFSTVVFAV